MTILKGIRDAYADIRWEFIRDYELADPAFSEFMSRLNEHEAGCDEESYGMSAEQIRELEAEMYADFGEECKLSAEEAWIIANDNLVAEHDILLYGDYKLRERSEAAWRKHRFSVIRDVLLTILLPSSSFASRKSRSART